MRLIFLLEVMGSRPLASKCGETWDSDRGCKQQTNYSTSTRLQLAIYVLRCIYLGAGGWGLSSFVKLSRLCKNETEYS